MMETQMQREPPERDAWHVGTESLVAQHRVYDYENRVVTTARSPEEAAQMVREHNNHDAMFAALEALEPYLTTEAQMLDSASLNEGRACPYDVASIKARRALAHVRAALATAKE